MVVRIYYYDINGDTQSISVRVEDIYGLMSVINALAAGSNFIQEVKS